MEHFGDVTMKMRSDSCLEKSNPEKILTRQFDKLANDPLMKKLQRASNYFTNNKCEERVLGKGILKGTQD